ncbi:MAG: hypothetical protein FJ387_24260 [Verrucomicrobia bacterium]|nr:hypothetical protein [Verrucomicrobiota bacterium]
MSSKPLLGSVKSLDQSGQGYDDDHIECINYAIAQRAHILNASWGGPQYGEPLREAIAAARNHGILFIAAAGNNQLEGGPGWDVEQIPNYPVCYDVDSIVGVVATTRNDDLAFYSCYGSAKTHLAAPGGSYPPSSDPKVNGVYSASYETQTSYAWKYGTSMSAPHVTGALALLRSYWPYESAVELMNRMLRSTDPLASLNTKCQTGGRLNLKSALTGSWPARPYNDGFANAVLLRQPIQPPYVLTAVGNNVNATKELGEPNHVGNPGGRSVWWTLLPMYNFQAELTTEGSGFSTLLAVYTGNTVSGLTQVAAHAGACGASQVNFYAQSGVAYRVAVDGLNGAAGTFKLTVRSAWPPTPLPSLTFSLDTVERTAGQFRVRITGPVSAQVIVQRSLDLLVWPEEAYATVTLGGTGSHDYVDASATAALGFYRAKILSPGRQNSCNTVGYVDLQAPPGHSFIANPLNATDNRVITLLPDVPEGTTLYHWDDTTDQWIINVFDLGEWSLPDLTLSPGKGARLRNPLAGPLALTFVGAVAQGYGVNPVDNGYCIRSSIIPQAGRVSTDLLMPILLMNDERLWRLMNGGYVESKFSDGVWYTFRDGSWQQEEPTLNVGESFWSYRNVGLWWSRNFLVWP